MLKLAHNCYAVLENAREICNRLPALLHMQKTLNKPAYYKNRKAQTQLLLTSSQPEDHTFRDLTFTFAVIALAAKLSVVDGELKSDEFSVFRELFPVPQTETAKVQQLFFSAMRDSMPASHYAKQIAHLFPPAKNAKLLKDVLQRLLQVAGADGSVNLREKHFLRQIAVIFSVRARDFAQMIRNYTRSPDENDPYLTLGVKPNWSDADIRRAYYALVRKHHPDAVRGRGGKDGAVLLAQRDLTRLNAAYTAILRIRKIARTERAA